MAASAAAVCDQRGQHARGQVFVALAAVAWSSAGLLQRELSVGTATQLAGRAAFAFVALVAFVAVAERGRVVAACRSGGRAALAFAVFTALASGSFIVALNHTSVAHVLFMQALAPVFAALLGRALLAEPVAPRAWLAMALALGGVGLMIGGPGGGGLLGDGVSLVMAFGFAASLVVTRWRRDVSMAPASCLAQLLIVVAAVPFAQPAQVGGHDLVLLFLLGAGQIGLGLAFLVVGARLIPAAEVALITLLEIVLGPLWVWLAIGERPSATTLAGGAVVIVAVTIQASAELGRRAAQPPPWTAQ